ncbi:PREDICTED: Williams-Beuren syndrome chromosomal region 27 protein [Ficedula albicollis]|uniref:Williams-Beuren syndrome chromosomal region 27 protein n=1 Tax=Ficedula albicollis TaxID=59894 RepID=UPI0007AD8F7A|nr:PREDICTED: Williams-Beuren syndrome chromosomal region 27 protein [Ficedula albicollis]
MGLPAAVRDRVAAVHRGSALPDRLRLYDGWAARYEQDVAALEYRAPHLAAASLAFAFPAPHAEARLLDVACGTGLVARELHRRGFRCLHGVDGSAPPLSRAGTGRGEPRRVPPVTPCVLAEHYDAVTLVGALGEGQVPSTVLPELLRVTRPGGFLCLTTRSNPSNLRYKAELEAALGQLERSGAWQKLLAQEVEYWERAVTEEESTQGNGYISGVVYIYQKCPVPHLEEG